MCDVYKQLNEIDDLLLHIYLINHLLIIHDLLITGEPADSFEGRTTCIVEQAMELIEYGK